MTLLAITAWLPPLVKVRSWEAARSVVQLPPFTGAYCSSCCWLSAALDSQLMFFCVLPSFAALFRMSKGSWPSPTAS